MKNELINYLKLNLSLSEDELESIISKFEKKELKKDRFLIKKGQIVDSYYYLESGHLRSYHIHNDKEHTLWIEAPGELVIEIKSIHLQQPTDYNIVAIEPVVYYSIKATELDKLTAEYPVLQNYMQHLWEVRFITARDGLRAFQTLNAKERYEYLLQNFPNFEKLPQHQLANILGVTQYTLSRIRGKK
ncbi:MAG: Crp/Fnr family transcriptional regulator [Bacteroidota bacterium]